MRLQHSVPVTEDYEAEAARLLESRVPSRLGAKDSTLFTGAVDTVQRMGWVDLPQRAAQLVDEIESLRSRLAAQGLRSISLTGMGGSSLAPEVMAEAAGVRLEVVDSTDPNQVAEAIGTTPCSSSRPSLERRSRRMRSAEPSPRPSNRWASIPHRA